MSGTTTTNNRQIVYAKSSSGGVGSLNLDSFGNLKTTGSGGGGGSSTSASLFTGQVTVNTTEVQVSASSEALSNGIIIKSLSTNSAPIYVGLVGVTDTTGDIIEPGEARGYAVNNLDLLYIISAASTTDVISYSAN